MCLQIRFFPYSSTRIRPKRAKEDIICYKQVYWRKGTKVLRGRFIHRYKYELNKLLVEKRFKQTFVRVKKGRLGEYAFVHEGFHTFAFLPFSERMPYSYCERDLYWMVCVIPAGALYYEGTFHGHPSFCSNQMLMLSRTSARSKRYLHNSNEKARRQPQMPV